ncbi:MAG TPA: type II CAAX endopeptidase family protein [Rubrobacter sp.]|jgi:membrane protease YdiL (CAAX protease family)|nr:type II CAAX endopeptidase family protein [Rubrobacter sp.]
MQTTLTTYTDGDDTRRRARRGLAIYLAAVVLITGIFDVVMIVTLNPLWIAPRMFAPAAASVVARLVLREGFADVSFRLGGRPTWRYIGLALVFPIIIALVAYGTAWGTGLARFDPRPSAGVGAQLASDVTSSPLLVFVVMLALSLFLWIIPQTIFAAGEEIGWRGYMLTRLIDSGVPRPILVSGVIWGLWHMPIVFNPGNVSSLGPTLSAVALMGTVVLSGYVYARMRLETGSVWPAIVLHGAWNSVFQTAFVPATMGAGAAWWVGESGVLTLIALAVAAIIFSRGHWTILRTPPKREKAPVRREGIRAQPGVR